MGNRFTVTGVAALLVAALAACQAGSDGEARDAGARNAVARNAGGVQRTGSATPTGDWEAWLDSPGGRLPFELRLESNDGGELRAQIHIGEEVPVPHVEWDGDALTLEFVHYDSRIRANWDRDHDTLHGGWERRSGPEKWSRLPFHAERAPDHDRTNPVVIGAKEAVDGRWSVQFSETDDPAVGIFEAGPSGRVHGTFLTTTGDYRFLEGETDGTTLRLAAFDGAHAFLFKARVQPDGTLQGDFWSRDTWHETWTAHRDPQAQLPDAMHLTRLQSNIALGDLAFPDVEGTLRPLDDPAFAGSVRIIELFGTWCPNCYDATRYLVELQKRYADRGVSILALAFEMTGDFERDANQVKRYVEHHDIEYPILVAGVSDKQEASKSFPLIDRVRAYPTFLFVDAQGRVRAIYTGFSGPATGPAYQALRRQFESLLDELLTES